jgi:UDP-N-acetylmuramyl tripeptide synthase
LFRDQLDLYGEIDVTLNYFKKSLALLDSEKLELIINADDAKLVGLTGLDLKAKILGFGLNIPNDKKPKFELDYILLPETIINNLWELSYLNKNKSSAKSDVSTSFVITKSSKNQFLGAEFETNLNGNYNLYNCLAAIVASSEISVSIIQKALKMQTEVFGRGEIIEIQNTKIKIILVKNPASFDQVLDQISESEQIKNLAFLINDNIADGRDVSWLWDINFENYLPKIKLGKVLTGGKRGMDMLLRLEYAGLKVNLENNQDRLESLLSEILQKPTFTVLCTYTAMTELRQLLSTKVTLKKINDESY